MFYNLSEVSEFLHDLVFLQEATHFSESSLPRFLSFTYISEVIAIWKVSLEGFLCFPVSFKCQIWEHEKANTIYQMIYHSWEGDGCGQTHSGSKFTSIFSGSCWHSFLKSPLDVKYYLLLPISPLSASSFQVEQAVRFQLPWRSKN